MVYGLGPRANRVYESLRERITSGELTPGTKLPAHTELAQQFGVAPLTMRQVLARLEERGMVSREQGRGTFVRARTSAAVLVVEDNAQMRSLLYTHITNQGYRAIEATDPQEALRILEQDSTIALVLSDVRMPDKEDGINFIRAVRRRWPDLHLGAITGYPEDLEGLHGTPECPVLILTKPVWANQITEALRMALPPPVEKEEEAVFSGAFR